jgi:hypothetical protein
MKPPRTPGRVASAAMPVYVICGLRAGKNRRSLPLDTFIKRICRMTTFDEREKGFERKFAHDEELRFKSTVRRNRLVGLWVAEKLGLAGAEAEAYARTVVKADFQQPGDEDVLAKLRADLAAANVDVPDRDLQLLLIEKLAEAVHQIETDTGRAQ